MKRIALGRPVLAWLGVVTLFLTLPGLAFPEILFGGQTLYVTDITWIHYPGHIFFAEEWLAGRIPLWDPYRNAGVPMLAEPQIGVLYPLRFLFLSPLPPPLEYSLFTLLHFSLAALFTFILARSLWLSRTAAVLAGLSFGLGGVLMAQVPNLNIMTGVVWLPLVLYAAIQVLRYRRWFIAMLGGIPIALQIFAAHSQIVFYTLVTITGYGLYQIIIDFLTGPGPARRNGRYALHTGLLLAVMMAAGLLLGAPQLLPSFELLGQTTRSGAQGADLLTENSLPPLAWINLVIPSALGNKVTGFRIGDPFQEDFIYAGFGPLLLAVLALTGLGQRGAGPKQRWSLFFGLLLGSGILMAMGDYTPLYDYVIRYLPGFDLFRIPARWLMVVNLAIAMLAGFGLEALLEGSVSHRRLVFFCSGCLLLGLGLGLVWAFRENLLAWSQALDRKYITDLLEAGFTFDAVYQERLLLRWVQPLTIPALLTMSNALIALILLGLFISHRLTRATFSALLLLAVGADLILAGGVTINPVKPAGWWQSLSGGARYVMEHLDAQHRVFPLGVNSEEWSRTHLGTYYPPRYRLHSAGGYASPLTLARYDTLLDEAHPVQGLQVLAVRYLLTPGQMGADVAATYPLVYRDEESYVYENPKALPRAFVVHQAVQAEDGAAALDYLRSLDLDLRQTVILEVEPGQPALSVSPGNSAGDQVSFLEETPQALSLKVNLDQAGYLVLLDTYYPGWLATLDGQPTPIYRANYLGRAVFVPAGEHIIQFRYRPFSFRLGLGLFLLVLGSLAIMAVAGRRRR